MARIKATVVAAIVVLSLITMSVPVSAETTAEDYPTDPDGDGKYEDVNGDGEFNIIDVGKLLHLVVNDDTSGPQFDFNNDSRVNVVDVGKLMDEYQNTTE